jgi:hypothetical protein
MKSVFAHIHFVRFPESVPEIENLTVRAAHSIRGMQAKSHVLSKSYELTEWCVGTDLDVLK